MAVMPPRKSTPRDRMIPPAVGALLVVKAARNVQETSRKAMAGLQDCIAGLAPYMPRTEVLPGVNDPALLPPVA